AVISYTDDSLTIVDVTHPSNIQVTTSLAAGDGNWQGTFPSLNGARDAETFLNGTDPYIVIVSHGGTSATGAIQVLSLQDSLDGDSEDGTNDAIYTKQGMNWTGGGAGFHSGIANNGDATHGTAISGSRAALNTPHAVAVWNNGSSTSPAYMAIVASIIGDSVQVFDMRDIGDGEMYIASNYTAAGTGFQSGRVMLDGASGVDTWNGGTVASPIYYAIVAASVDDGLQAFELRSPYGAMGANQKDKNAGAGGGLVPIGNVTDTGHGYELLNGVIDVATFEQSGNDYAIAVSEVDDAFIVILLDDPLGASNGGSTLNTFINKQVSNGTDGSQYIALDSPTSVEVLRINDRPYGVITNNATDASGIQIVDLYNPSAPQPVDTALDSNNADGYTELLGSNSVSFFTKEGQTYAIVAAEDDSGIQIIKLTADQKSSGGGLVCGVSKDCTAPSITKDSDGVATDGFSINGVDLENQDRFNVNDTVDVKVGEMVTIKALVYDSFGPSAITKSNLYFDMPNAPEWSDSAASIRYDIGRDEVEITDGNGIFDATVTSEIVGDRLEVTFKIMFGDEMGASHIAIQNIDSDRNYQLIYFKDALVVTGTPTQTSLDDSVGDEVTQTSTASVPDWVKNTAGWWAEGQITESEFVSAIEHLVKTGTIIII
nr:hypothetical protein [Candidatus Nitrosopelagicus sp.]